MNKKIKITYDMIRNAVKDAEGRSEDTELFWDGRCGHLSSNSTSYCLDHGCNDKCYECDPVLRIDPWSIYDYEEWSEGHDGDEDYETKDGYVWSNFDEKWYKFEDALDFCVDDIMNFNNDFNDEINEFCETYNMRS